MVDPTRGERWRRWNDRQKRCVSVIPVEIDYLIVEHMLDRGLIAERDSENREKIGIAIRNYLANAFGEIVPEISESLPDDTHTEESLAHVRHKQI